MSNDDAGKHPLLPCPFCGATDSLRVVGAHKGEGWGFVRCDICDAEGPDPDSGVFWNDRAPSAEMIERAADALPRLWTDEDRYMYARRMVCAVTNFTIARVIKHRDMGPGFTHYNSELCGCVPLYISDVESGAKQRGKEGAMYRCPTCSGGGEIAPNAECPDCDGTGSCTPPAV